MFTLFQTLLDGITTIVHMYIWISVFHAHGQGIAAMDKTGGFTRTRSTMELSWRLPITNV